MKMWLLALILGVGPDGVLSSVPTQDLPRPTQKIMCPEGRHYRLDDRREACELGLPGFLSVRDGLSRWWFTDNMAGTHDVGVYRLGRKVGRWQECDRFARCREITYEWLTAEEQTLGVKPQIPVTFVKGKYVFDFGSCWSTWVTRREGASVVELNIGRHPIRCLVTYIPADGPSYLCEIPYEVGVREFDSIDLRRELIRSGLTQFCRPDDPPATMPRPNGIAAMGLAVSGTTLYNRYSNNELSGFGVLANSVDVVCAAIVKEPSGAEVLSVRFNAFAERILLDHLQKSADTKAEACGGRYPLTVLADRGRSSDGGTLFRYALNPARTETQRACLGALRPLAQSCAR